MTHQHSGQHDGKSQGDAAKAKPRYRNLLDEVDIGSGERTPGEEDTDRIVREVKPTGKAAQPTKPDPAAKAQADAQADAQAVPGAPPPDKQPPDPEAEQIGLADDLVDEIADDEATAAQPGGTSEISVDTNVHEKRIAIEQDEPDSMLNDLDPVPPKGN